MGKGKGKGKKGHKGDKGGYRSQYSRPMLAFDSSKGKGKGNFVNPKGKGKGYRSQYLSRKLRKSERKGQKFLLIWK